MKKGQNFYRRDPAEALAGMVGLSLEERGVYNTVLDLLYSTWRPLEDNRAFIANWCGCAVQRLNPILRRLIEAEKLCVFTEGGRAYLSNPAFERERAAVKGEGSTRSGRAKVEEKSGKVGEKLGEVGQNTGVLDGPGEQNQSDGRLDREEKRREDSPLPPEGHRKRKPETPLPDDCPTAELIATMQAEARASGANVDMAFEAKQFRDWWTSKDGRNRDWSATWRTWARRTIRDAPKTAVAALSTRPTASEDERWRRWVREFKANRYWPVDDAGPRPGQPDCRVPPHILAEFGIEPISANDDLFSARAAG